MTNKSANQSLMTGVVPVAPTVFLANESLDLPGQQRVTEYLLDAGVDGICILANYSEQFSLTDDERLDVLDATVEAVSGRARVMVTTSHFSSRIAAARSKEAVNRGATMLMLMPPFFGTTMSVDDDSVVEFFKVVADDLDVDIMIQDAPLSSTTLSVELLAKIAQEVEQLRYVKIEQPRTAAKLRKLASAAPHLPGLFDGEESITLIPDLESGAIGTMCSALIPDRLGQIVRQYLTGHHEEAVSEWERLLPLIHFENRQCGLQAAKSLLAAGGIIGSAASRAPLRALDDRVAQQLFELALKRDALILRWA